MEFAFMGCAEDGAAILEDIRAGRPTMAPGEFPGDRRRVSRG
ncbi:hypothetical protein [Bradyrhizobium sp. McL0616]